MPAFHLRRGKNKRKAPNHNYQIQSGPKSCGALSSGISVAHRCNPPPLSPEHLVSSAISERKAGRLRHKMYLWYWKGQFKRRFYVSQRTKREASARALYLLPLFSCLSKPKLHGHGQYSAVIMTTSVPDSLRVRTYWLKLQSSAGGPTREKHPDTKEPIGTCITVSL